MVFDVRAPNRCLLSSVAARKFSFRVYENDVQITACMYDTNYMQAVLCCMYDTIGTVEVSSGSTLNIH